MKKLLSFLLVLTMIFALSSCNLFKKDPDKDPAPPAEVTPEESKAVALVTVDINPSVEITLEDNGNVAHVYGANEDGQILLYGEIEAIVGKSYEEAVAYITDLAIKLGYLDAETGTVSTSVTADDEAFADEVQNKLSAKIVATASDNGITIQIETEDPFSLICEFEAFKEKYPDNTDVQNATITEYKLAVRLSEREGISVVAALHYDSGEMIKRIDAANSKLEAYATEAYLAVKREATRIFDKAMGLLIDGAYTEIYMKNAMLHADTFYYGSVYQAYATVAKTYRSIYEIKAFGDKVGNFELTDEMIASIKTDLGLTDTTALEDENGKITVDSLIAFCDKFLAENEVGDDVKLKIELIIAEAKHASELADMASTSMYMADMIALKTQLGAVIGAVNAKYAVIKASPVPLLTDEAKAEIEATLEALRAVEANVDKIMSDGITLSEADVLATEAELLASEMLEKIKADLSESELAEVEANIEKLNAKKAELVAEFEARLAEAEAQAKAEIEAARKAREEAHNAN